MVVEAGHDGGAAEDARPTPEAAVDQLEDGGPALRPTHHHVRPERGQLLGVLGDDELKVRGVPHGPHAKELEPGPQVHGVLLEGPVHGVSGSTAVDVHDSNLIVHGAPGATGNESFVSVVGGGGLPAIIRQHPELSPKGYGTVISVSNIKNAV